MAVYLQINYSDGKLFEYSKDQKEGFEKHESSTGKISFRRYLMKGLYGTFKGVERRDSNFGDQLSVTMVDENGVTNYLSIPLFDGQKGISTYAEGLIANLKGMKQGETYRIYSYAIENEGKKYVSRGISVKHADLSTLTVSDSVEKYTNSYTDKEGNEVVGDIPKVIWKEKLGTNVPDKDNKNEFLYNALMQFIGGAKPSTPTTPVTNTPKENFPPAPNFNQEAEDDLPFN